MDLLEPSGTVRATLPPGASVEALLGAAWGLREGLDTLVVLAVADGWELFTYRAGPGGPTMDPTGVRTAGEAPREAMIETAWAELLDEGWSVR